MKTRRFLPLLFLAGGMAATGAIHDETIKWGAYSSSEWAMLSAGGPDVYG